MELVFAFTCDYAMQSGGKIHALGIGFDTIFARDVPFKHRQFFLVAKLRASIAEAGDKRVTVSLIDADGNDVFPPAQARLTIPRPQGSIETTANLLMGFDNLEFGKFGDHSLHLVVEGHEMAAIPIRILPAPSTGAG